jgi:hypothetical protein
VSFKSKLSGYLKKHLLNLQEEDDSVNAELGHSQNIFQYFCTECCNLFHRVSVVSFELEEKNNSKLSLMFS